MDSIGMTGHAYMKKQCTVFFVKELLPAEILDLYLLQSSYLSFMLYFKKHAIGYSMVYLHDRRGRPLKFFFTDLLDFIYLIHS